MTPHLPSKEASGFVKNNIEVLLQFVQPCTSPVYKALADGAKLFDGDMTFTLWRCYFAYTALDEAAAWEQAWLYMLPVLARLSTRVLIDLNR